MGLVAPCPPPAPVIGQSFRLLLQNLTGLRLFDATAALDVDVGRMLDRFRGTKLTYVDASSLCLLEQHKVRRVWSTDHHLGMTGAEVLPRS